MSMYNPADDLTRPSNGRTTTAKAAKRLQKAAEIVGVPVDEMLRLAQQRADTSSHEEAESTRLFDARHNVIDAKQLVAASGADVADTMNRVAQRIREKITTSAAAAVPLTDVQIDAIADDAIEEVLTGQRKQVFDSVVPGWEKKEKLAQLKMSATRKAVRLLVLDNERKQQAQRRQRAKFPKTAPGTLAAIRLSNKTPTGPLPSLLDLDTHGKGIRFFS